VGPIYTTLLLPVTAQQKHQANHTMVDYRQAADQLMRHMMSCGRAATHKTLASNSSAVSSNAFLLCFQALDLQGLNLQGLNCTHLHTTLVHKGWHGLRYSRKPFATTIGITTLLWAGEQQAAVVQRKSKAQPQVVAHYMHMGW